MPALYDPVMVYDATQKAYWDTQVVIEGTQKLEVPASSLHLSIMSARFRRTQPTGLSEDLAQFSIAFASQAAGLAPLVWLGSSDAATVEVAFTANWWTAVKPVIADDWILQDITWRNTGADYPVGEGGFVKPGPVWRTTSIELAGTSVNARVADQVACSVTMRTASRRHWGRFYVGGLATSWFSDSRLGRLLPANVDIVATATDAFLKDLADNPLIINAWIWSPRYKGALSVNQLSVDDVPDVIRSRRAKHPSYRKTFG